jgi:hypothetical protein
LEEEVCNEFVSFEEVNLCLSSDVVVVLLGRFMASLSLFVNSERCYLGFPCSLSRKVSSKSHCKGRQFGKKDLYYCSSMSLFNSFSLRFLLHPKILGRRMIIHGDDVGKGKASESTWIQ